MPITVRVRHGMNTAIVLTLLSLKELKNEFVIAAISEITDAVIIGYSI
jgi:hypothetical protein